MQKASYVWNETKYMGLSVFFMYVQHIGLPDVWNVLYKFALPDCNMPSQ